MKKQLEKPPKAYKNADFLSSPDARSLRIFSEFAEPQSRFRRQNIKDTIVFFGSARIKEKKEAKALLKQAEGTIAKSKRPTKKMLLTLRSAQHAVEMSRYYDDCVELSRLLSEWSKKLNHTSRFIVCSGGGPGIMEAANRGAHLAGAKTIGLNISLPFEQFSNGYISPGLNFEFHYFFMRKFWFAYLAKALVVFPGGFGTMDELLEILTLLQTDKIKKRMAVVIYGTEYWNKIINFDEIVRMGMASQEDLSLFKFFDDPQEAFAYLKDFLLTNYPNPGKFEAEGGHLIKPRSFKRSSSTR
ncbi:MAG: LOG family protein [Ignavibacteriae bacterium]|nr:LOG family protein [Ignavibacteriota bacterium]